VLGILRETMARFEAEFVQSGRAEEFARLKVSIVILRAKPTGTTISAKKLSTRTPERALVVSGRRRRERPCRSHLAAANHSAWRARTSSDN